MPKALVYALSGEAVNGVPFAVWAASEEDSADLADWAPMDSQLSAKPSAGGLCGPNILAR